MCTFDKYFRILGLLNIDIFPPEVLRGCLAFVICNSSAFHSFIFYLSIADCSHNEHVHPIFSADLIIYFGVELRHYYFYTTFRVLKLCKLYVICR